MRSRESEDGDERVERSGPIEGGKYFVELHLAVGRRKNEVPYALNASKALAFNF